MRLSLAQDSIVTTLNMSNCSVCLGLINNGDFCKPVSRSYQDWYLFRETFCDRAFIYGSILFHSLNNIRTQALHPNTCKYHAKERTRLLNHFSFLADPNNAQDETYFSPKHFQKSVGYILKRNIKTQAFTLYSDSPFEEKISEVSCSVILLVGPQFNYTYQDVFTTHIPSLSEGYILAKFKMKTPSH